MSVSMVLLEKLLQKARIFCEKQGLNPLVDVPMVVILYVSLYVWLPLAVLVPLPLWSKGVVTILLYIAPFAYPIGIRLWRKYHPRPFQLEIRPFHVEEIGGWAKLADLIREYWAYTGPWGEYLRCPSCANRKGGGFYDTVATISFEQAASQSLNEGSPCPECSSPLSLFWTVQSVQEYLKCMSEKPDYHAIAGWIDGRFAGWLFFYQNSDDGSWYPDTIAITGEFRDRPFRYALVKVFLREMFAAKRRGYKMSTFRTHRKAYNVTALARLMGYHPRMIDPKDSNRVFWNQRLTWLGMGKVWFLITLLDRFPALERRVVRRRG